MLVQYDYCVGDLFGVVVYWCGRFWFGVVLFVDEDGYFFGIVEGVFDVLEQ